MIYVTRDTQYIILVKRLFTKMFECRARILKIGKKFLKNMLIDNSTAALLPQLFHVCFLNANT